MVSIRCARVRCVIRWTSCDATVQMVHQYKEHHSSCRVVCACVWIYGVVVQLLVSPTYGVGMRKRYEAKSGRARGISMKHCVLSMVVTLQ